MTVSPKLTLSQHSSNYKPNWHHFPHEEQGETRGPYLSTKALSSVSKPDD